MYRPPFGPNSRPRGWFSPVATVDMTALVSAETFPLDKEKAARNSKNTLNNINTRTALLERSIFSLLGKLARMKWRFNIDKTPTRV
jgi:hypothetical protein